MKDPAPADDGETRPKRARKPVYELPRALRLEPDEHLHPNYFLLGMGEDDIVIPNPLLEEYEAPRKTPRRAHTREKAPGQPSTRQARKPASAAAKAAAAPESPA